MYTQMEAVLKLSQVGGVLLLAPRVGGSCVGRQNIDCNIQYVVGFISLQTKNDEPSYMLCACYSPHLHEFWREFHFRTARL